MITGIFAGVTWAIETVVLGIAMGMMPMITPEEAMFLAPFAATFLHDAFSAVFTFIFNAVRGNIKKLFSVFKNPNVKWLIVASAIGGPIGMTGYVLAVNYMGASVGTVASAVYPAIGTVLACVFLKERVKWYQWIFLLLTLFGVYGLSYSPTLDVQNFWLGLTGAFMCALGWGIEAVVLAKCLKDQSIKNQYALNIRQTVSAVIYGLILLPVLGGWKVTASAFEQGNSIILLPIAIAALAATVSYLFYYKTIAKVGASKAMALNITYTAWAIVFTVILGDTSVINPLTLSCAVVIVICGILAATDVKTLFSKNKEQKESCIQLTPITISDVELLDQTEYKNLSLERREELVKDSENRLCRGEFFRFYLIKNHEEFIGVINMCGHGDGVVSIAPEIIERFRNKGYAKESLLKAYSIARKVGFKTVTAGIKPDNIASIKLHEKLGFEFVEEHVNKNGNAIRTYKKYIGENMQFRVLSEQEKLTYKRDVIEMLKGSDKDFVPPLSARTSTTQSDLSATESSEQGLLSYYQEMNNQQILGAFDEQGLIGFVSYRENYLSSEIGEDDLPNIYLSTLVLKPEARGKHVTYQMYDYLFNQLYPNHSIFTRTWSTNAAHIRILSKFDFIEFIRKPNDRGEGIDTVYFCKRR